MIDAIVDSCSYDQLLGHEIDCLLILCDLQLPAAKQLDIANELDRKPGEVLKKLEDIRNKIL